MQTSPYFDAPFVADVEPREDRTLVLTFEGGERRVFDLKPYLGGEVFRPLTGDAFFEVRVAHGSLEWPCGADLAHDMLYAQSTPTGRATTLRGS